MDLVFLYSSPLPRLQATGSTHREKVRRSLEGTVFRCVNTQPAIVWPEDKLNQYGGVTGGRAFLFAVEITWSVQVFLFLFLSSDVVMGPENTSVHPSISARLLYAPISNPKLGLKFFVLKKILLKSVFLPAEKQRVSCCTHLHHWGEINLCSTDQRWMVSIRKKNGHTCFEWCMLMSVKKSHQNKRGNKCLFVFFYKFYPKTKWQHHEVKKKKKIIACPILET